MMLKKITLLVNVVDKVQIHLQKKDYLKWIKWNTKEWWLKLKPWWMKLKTNKRARVWRQREKMKITNQGKWYMGR
jgi:hypothetical protein